MVDTAGSVALRLDDLHKSFGRTDIIRGVTLDVKQGERHAVIGPNGAGKSTIFNLVSGRMRPTRGKIFLDRQPIEGLAPFEINRLGLSRSFQITNVFPRLSVFENIRCAVLCARGKAFSLWRNLDGAREISERCRVVLDSIGLADRHRTLAESLTYAEMRALELGLTIAGDARVILLDEPMAGMSRTEGARALELIRKISIGRTLLLVEHDMNVVFEIADRISVLVYGQIIATGTPAEIRASAAVQEAYLGQVAQRDGGAPS
jgi:branched-chain amino acid transport system ATP-binding protein